MNTTASLQFSVIGKAVAAQFQKMTKQGGLFRVKLTKDELWAMYLGSFPPGTNPLYRERTEHDCQCCKSFVRTLGGVVALKDGKFVTIWDVEVDEPAYQAVCDAMAALVRTAAIDNVFLHAEPTVGTAKTFEQVLKGVPLGNTVSAKNVEKHGAQVVTWEHFHVTLPKECVKKGAEIGPRLSEARAAHDVLERGLEELTLDACDAVLELVAQNALYRGEEHKFAVAEFRKLKQAFGNATLPPSALDPDLAHAARRADVFCWARAANAGLSNGGTANSVLRIRNTSIGQLLIDLSAGVDMEDAVKKFEAMVAPANYKRPTAPVTKAMVGKARAAVEELGYTSALERRYAVIEDLTINNVLFADRATKLKAGEAGTRAFDDIAAKVPEKTARLDKVEEVPVDKFLADVLPRAETLEVLFENRHAGNLVSLVAPVDPAAKLMFKWPNGFSWSYAGEAADSIKERVKKAGGSVTGDLCCRLAWDYADDLDLHMREPGNGHVWYAVKRLRSRCGGVLDLDANGGDGMRADPAENIVYADKGRMPEGVYELYVNNYRRRGVGAGFDVEIEFDGVVHGFSYGKALRTGEDVAVAKIRYTREDGFKIAESLPSSSQTGKTVWGATTQTFHKVSLVAWSPNYWWTAVSDSFAERSHGVGNRHLFFMLDGCRNADGARGFYNEFLKEELAPHRKVFEMVGAKMRTEGSDRQLSGLGFSSTKRDSVTVRVGGAFKRVVKVVF